MLHAFKRGKKKEELRITSKKKRNENNGSARMEVRPRRSEVEEVRGCEAREPTEAAFFLKREQKGVLLAKPYSTVT